MSRASAKLRPTKQDSAESVLTRLPSNFWIGAVSPSNTSRPLAYPGSAMPLLTKTIPAATKPTAVNPREKNRLLTAAPFGRSLAARTRNRPSPGAPPWNPMPLKRKAKSQRRLPAVGDVGCG